MSLFKSKDEKRDEALEKTLSTVQLDLGEEDMEVVRSFADNYNKALSSLAGSALGAKQHEINLVYSNLTVMQQNMLIIKQLERLNRNMEMMIHR